MGIESLENIVKVASTVFVLAASILGIEYLMIKNSEMLYDLMQLKQKYREGNLDRKPNYFNVGGFSK